MGGQSEQDNEPWGNDLNARGGYQACLQEDKFRRLNLSSCRPELALEKQFELETGNGDQFCFFSGRHAGVGTIRGNMNSSQVGHNGDN